MKVRGALAVLIVVTLAGCARDRGVQAAEGQKTRAVKSEAAQLRDVRRQVDVVGTLAAREEVIVSAEVAGRVALLRHDLGDRVEKGDVLIELDQE
jgi:multidrug efflux pump subunit AcrA (membrane-fusion protein)